MFQKIKSDDLDDADNGTANIFEQEEDFEGAYEQFDTVGKPSWMLDLQPFKNFSIFFEKVRDDF